MTDRCDAHAGDRGDGYPAAHTCDDPLLCALGSLVDGDDPTEVELKRLHAMLDEIEDLTHGRKTLRVETVLKLIHDERSGPR